MAESGFPKDRAAPNHQELSLIRALAPNRIAKAMAHRTRPTGLPADGRLFVIAADHPARGALASGANKMAMANREELLARLAIALKHPGVDGVLGTPDILEDLALMGALENKLVVGSMNRAGLAGSAFEIDDRFTAYQVPDLVEQGLDMGKLLLRIDLKDPTTALMLERTAAQVTAAARAQIPLMLEPFMSTVTDGKIRNLLDPDSVITSIAIASGLGASSAYSWLKLPVVAQMERVMEATTLPTVLLGGDPTTSPQETFAQWEHALGLPSVRGLMVGRTLLFPPDDDVAGAIDIAARLVHTAPKHTDTNRITPAQPILEIS